MNKFFILFLLSFLPSLSVAMEDPQEKPASTTTVKKETVSSTPSSNPYADSAIASSSVALTRFQHDPVSSWLDVLKKIREARDSSRPALLITDMEGTFVSIKGQLLQPENQKVVFQELYRMKIATCGLTNCEEDEVEGIEERITEANLLFGKYLPGELQETPIVSLGSTQNKIMGCKHILKFFQSNIQVYVVDDFPSWTKFIPNICKILGKIGASIEVIPFKSLKPTPSNS